LANPKLSRVSLTPSRPSTSALSHTCSRYRCPQVLANIRFLVQQTTRGVASLVYEQSLFLPKQGSGICPISNKDRNVRMAWKVVYRQTALGWCIKSHKVWKACSTNKAYLCQTMGLGSLPYLPWILGALALLNQPNTFDQKWVEYENSGKAE